MSTSSFTDAVSSLGWSRRDRTEPSATSQRTGLLSSIQSFNPFHNQSYIRLPTSDSAGAALPAPTRRQEEEGWFVLSHWDRMLVFAACVVGSIVCFAICFTLLPVLAFSPRKFVILWTTGSALFLASFAAVMGPMAYLRHLLAPARLLFTVAYFGMIVITFVLVLSRKHWLLVLLAGGLQMASLLWYLVSYFPMGTSGLRLAATFGARQASAWMSG